MVQITNNEERALSDLVGRIIVSITYDGDDYLRIVTKCGAEYWMGHHQNCCESVSLIEGEDELRAMVGQPITSATVESNRDDAPLYERQDSYTWTYYKFSCPTGTATLRWYGSSNGYYGESVNFERHK